MGNHGLLITIHYGLFEKDSLQFLPSGTDQKGGASCKSLFILDLGLVPAQFPTRVLSLHVYSTT